jgi:hypothetical protein
LDDLWNGTDNGYNSQVAPPAGIWSMVAWVVTSTNSTLYICSSNNVSPPYIQTPVSGNPYQSWGGPITIGGYFGSNNPASNFVGDISSVAMFTYALSADQVAILYYAGVDLDQTAPVISIEPVATATYRNHAATFSVSASGITNAAYPTIGYQWQINTGTGWINLTNGTVNGYGPISGANSATLVISSALLTLNGASFQVVIRDSFGSTPSTPVTLSVVDTDELSTYAQAVVSLNPIAYYELNEASGTVANDYVGGHLGAYGSNVTLFAEAGPNLSANDGEFVNGGFSLTNWSPLFTNAYIVGTNWASDLNLDASNQCLTSSEITIPALNLDSNVMTILMWIYPNENQTTNCGLLYSEGTQAGFGFKGTNGGLGYNWGTATAGTTNGPIVTNWNMVACVVTPSNTTFYCYNTNAQSVSVANATNIFMAWSSPSVIGNNPLLPNGQGQFDGAISEVAIFNQALTGDQVDNLFITGSGYGIPAVITQAPASAAAYMLNAGANSTMTLTASAIHGPLGFKWDGPGGLTITTNGA